MVTAVTDLAVVVPATDAPPTLSRCLAAIHAADDPPDEVVVVDGPASLSAAGARNAGVARATADVVVFVDADVEVRPDAFTRLRAAFAADPGLAAVYGSYDDSPADRTTVSGFRNLLHHHVHHAGAGPATTFWTGLGAVRRSSFLAVGGFDEQRYPHPSIEDIELGHRMTATGARIELDPTIQGTHLKVWTLRSMLWTDFARRGVPWVALQARDRRMSRALNLGWRHRLSAVACVLAVAAAVLGEVVPAATALVTLLVLNRSFYALLARRLGAAAAAAGVLLHGLHHLVSVAAVPAGLATAALPRTAPPPRRLVPPAPSDASDLPSELTAATPGRPATLGRAPTDPLTLATSAEHLGRPADTATSDAARPADLAGHETAPVNRVAQDSVGIERGGLRPVSAPGASRPADQVEEDPVSAERAADGVPVAR